jgi:hypothetical protein
MVSELLGSLQILELPTSLVEACEEVLAVADVEFLLGWVGERWGLGKFGGSVGAELGSPGVRIMSR